MPGGDFEDLLERVEGVVLPYLIPLPDALSAAQHVASADNMLLPTLSLAQTVVRYKQ